eukprot:TRINITY_DN2717_c0_g1_i12.p2 TRINITY_DN2717_c0_g1~~TRINITY_DN2717_c0_g1_i12.p2  ORF type:complete len:236 (+),score=82.90 TRINITY_DN2717_c0_g1_i12:632-1339(+)
MKYNQSAKMLTTAAMDDTVRVTSTESKEYDACYPMDVQPTGVAQGTANVDLTVVTTLDSIIVMNGGEVTHTEKVGFKPTCVDLSKDETEVVVGGDDQDLHVYALADGVLTENTTVTDHRGQIVQVLFSPDDTMYAACDTNREIRVYSRDEHKVKAKGWVFHSGRVNCIAWSPDNIHVASGGVDKNIFVWNVNKPTKRLVYKGAHLQGVEQVVFVNENTIISSGSDCHMKTWEIEY